MCFTDLSCSWPCGLHTQLHWRPMYLNIQGESKATSPNTRSVHSPSFQLLMASTLFLDLIHLPDGLHCAGRMSIRRMLLLHWSMCAHQSFAWVNPVSSNTPLHPLWELSRWMEKLQWGRNSTQVSVAAARLNRNVVWVNGPKAWWCSLAGKKALFVCLCSYKLLCVVLVADVLLHIFFKPLLMKNKLCSTAVSIASAYLWLLVSWNFWTSYRHRKMDLWNIWILHDLLPG